MLCLFLACEVHATTRFVNVNNPTPAPPYTSWPTASTNIQLALNLSQTGDSVLVTNGVYDSGGTYLSGSNRVVHQVANCVLRSVNGPAVTIIKGYQVPGLTNGPAAIRCVYLSSGSTLSGFTLLGGATIAGESGGGVRGQASDSVVTNCIFIGNSAYTSGGGIYQGKVFNSTFISNTVTVGGGAGGGAAAQSLLYNCILSRNFSAYISGGANNSTLINCTVVSNSAASYAGSGWNSVYKNCIVYYNHSYNVSPDDGPGYCTGTNCCTDGVFATGTNIFHDIPLFVDGTKDFHLNPLSPCVNRGLNSVVTNNVDMDGNPRIAGVTVDVGAYEVQSPIQVPIHYVNLNSTTPVAPYTNWFQAANNIASAIQAAAPGDVVALNDGYYWLETAYKGGIPMGMVIDKPVTVMSISGPSATELVYNSGAVTAGGGDGVYITNGATLSGLTLTGHQLYLGGAIQCESSNSIVTNCIITGNIGHWGGGIYKGTVVNCILSNNAAWQGGGAYSNILVNCLLTGNRSSNIDNMSGGAATGCSLTGCVLVANSSLGSGGATVMCNLTGCVVSNNSAEFYGGGVYLGTADSCLISSNRAALSGGGAYTVKMKNSVLRDNVATSGGGASGGTLVNCTVINNTGTNGVGGVTPGTFITNSILYWNTSPKGVANFSSSSGPLINYCCTTPLPIDSVGNITNEPVFADLANEDFHLQSNAPCINSGNNTFVASSTDFGGNSRIVGGTVDIGAYEYQSPASTISYAYLQQYGLPTDGTADNADTDGDGFKNWQEWRAGTSPTDATSLLQMLTTSNSVSGATVTWQSVAGVTYLVQRAGNLAAQPAFSTIQSNIVGQAGTTSYTDTSAVGGAQFFYRVGVQ